MGFAACSLVGPHGTHQGPTPVASKRYQRHEPEATPLYQIVAEHLESFLAEARETQERALPQHVERELREHLKCGILAHGFLRTTENAAELFELCKQKRARNLSRSQPSAWPAHQHVLRYAAS